MSHAFAFDFSRGGEPVAVIVTKDTPTEAESRAADILVQWLDRMGGGRFQICRQGDYDGILAPVFVGISPEGDQMDSAICGFEFGDDGYAIQEVDGALYLWGGERRGAIHAVSSLLQDDLGVRMFTGRFRHVPVSADISADISPRASKPAFPELRDYLAITCLNEDYCLFNALEPLWVPIPPGLGGRLTHYTQPWLSHSYDYIAPAAEMQAHPEMFAMTQNGARTPAQRCPANPEFRARALDWVRSQFHEFPDANIAIIGMNDNYERCHCPDCEGAKVYANHYSLLNEAARMVAQEFPGKRVGTLAYFGAGMPPEGYVPESNVVIWLCTDCVPDGERQKPASQNAAFASRMEAWRKTGANLHIWDYAVTYINNFNYDTTLYAMQENLRYYRDNGVTGVQLEGPLGSGGEREPLRAWASSRLLWNPDLETPALIEEYCRASFGMAAAPVNDFYQWMYQVGKQGGNFIGWGNFTPSRELLERGLDAFGTALQLADGDDGLMERLRFEAAPVLLLAVQNLALASEDYCLSNHDEILSLHRQAIECLAALIQKYDELKYVSMANTPFADYLANWKPWHGDADPPKDSVILNGAHSWIWRWTGPAWVKDAKTTSGSALSLPYTPNEYPVRWMFQSYPSLTLGGKFVVKLRVKAESTGEGPLVDVGFYSTGKGFVRCRTLDGGQISDEYQWLDAGIADIEEKPQDGYFYIRALPGTSARGLMVDAVMLAPLGGKQSPSCSIPQGLEQLVAPVLTPASSPAFTPAPSKPGEILLADDKTAYYDILLPEEPTPKELRAAEELRKYLNAITGASFSIVRDGPAHQPGRPEIILRASSHSELGTDGVLIWQKDDSQDICLAGGSRRGVHGTVCWMLDKLGVRWWTPTETSIPRHNRLAFPAKTYYDEPAFPQLRDCQTALANEPDWTIHNLANGVYSGVPDELGGFVNHAFANGRWWFGHTYASILPSTQENFERYPAAFMMDENGRRVISQLCPSSPIVHQLAVQEVLDALRQCPNDWISISQSDWPIRCQCPDCNALVEREETEAAPHLELVNHVARAVRKEFPEAHPIVFLGYQRTRKPPKTIVMEPNTVLWLCTDIQSQAKHVPIRTNRQFTDNLEKWRKAMTGSIWIWDYTVNFNNFMAYEPTLYAVRENLLFYKENGIAGVMLQGDLQSPGGAMEVLNNWVFSRLLWHPELNLDDLIDEFCSGYFEGAGAPMARLYKTVAAIGAEGRLAAENPEAFDAMEHGCLVEARRRAGENPVILRRLDVAELPWLIRTVNAASIAACKAGTQPGDDFILGISRIRAICRENKVTHFSEGGLIDDFLDRIQKRASIDLAPRTFQPEAGVTAWKLSSLWKFRPLNLITTSEEIAEATRQAIRPEADDSAWNDYIDCLGIGWEEQGYPGFDGTGLFRNSFELPDSLPEDAKHWYILMGSADEEAVIYINGALVCEHTLKTTGLTIYNIWNHPVAAEIPPPCLRPSTNIITISCHDSAQMGGIYMPTWIFASDHELSRKDLWRLSGAVHPYGLDAGDPLSR